MKKWELKKLGEVCEFIGGSQPPKSDFSFEKKENYIRLIQIRDYKSNSHIVYIPKSKARRFCKSDDIMIGRYGPPVFQILKGLEGAYNVALMKAVPNEKLLSKDFAFLFNASALFESYLQLIFSTEGKKAAQPDITHAIFKVQEIALPPLKDQLAIVKKLNALSDITKKLEAIYQQKLDDLEELKKSILQKAFAGQLVVQRSIHISNLAIA